LKGGKGLADEIQTNIESKAKFQHCVPRIYAKSNVFSLWTTGGKSSAQFTNEQISNLLKDPYTSYKKLRDVSNWLYANSQVYVNLIDYLSKILAFDYVVFPEETTANQTTMKNRFYSATKTIAEASVKEVFPVMLARTFVNGSTYWYDLTDSQNTIFVELDSRICQMAMIDNDGIWRYFIDLSMITQDKFYEYPSEIRDAYTEWVTKGSSRSKEMKQIEGDNIEIPSNLYLVSKRGFTLTSHMEKSKNDYPLLAPMFKDLNVAEDNKTYLNDTLKAETIKLVHLKIPVDDEGFPLLDKDMVDAYHESAKEHMPANVAPMTNPFEVTAIALDKSQQNQTNLVQHSQSVITNDSGVSATIFSADTTNGLAYSTQKDVQKMIPYLYYFTNIINLKVKSQKMKIKFLPIGAKERLDWHKQYSADLAMGGSRMLWLSTSGIEIYDALRVLEFEKFIDIDSLLPAKMSANQMNTDDVGGRPEVDEGDKSDQTVVGNKYK